MYNINDLPDRIKAKIAIQESGCWVWMGAKRRQYGAVRLDKQTDPSRRMAVAHRLVYELLAGPIPEGLQIDHLCRNRACVNPGHLEPVTGTENRLRGFSPVAANSRKTHCPRGHEYTPENTYHFKRGMGYVRRCRECQKFWNAARNRKPIKK